MSKPTYSILAVDDERNILKLVSATLKKQGYAVETALSAEEAIEKFNASVFDLVLSDLKLPGRSGIELLDYVRNKDPNLPIIMMTAFGTIENAVEAMKKGAFNYLTKPVNPDELISVAKEAIEKYDLRRENLTLKSELRDKYSFSNIIGKSDAMQNVFDTVSMVARSQSSVLITGESGTGKELVARAIHFNSERSEQSFHTIDCTSIPADIMESELFGHEKGAFTGAHERKIGLLEHANRGTVFFDEIGDLDLGLQKKLLRFLQEREIRRLGGKERISLDVRIISATNRELENEVKVKHFREDLYYRLNVVSLRIPPLRERKDDIPLLAQHFIEKLNRIEGKNIKGFEDNVLDAFSRHDWPGNVRELENTVERAYVLCPNVNINLKYLPPALLAIVEGDQTESETFNLQETEVRLITKALNESGWNQSKAADILGITRKQLRTKMKNHNLLPA